MFKWEVKIFGWKFLVTKRAPIVLFCAKKKLIVLLCERNLLFFCERSIKPQGWICSNYWYSGLYSCMPASTVNALIFLRYSNFQLVTHFIYIPSIMLSLVSWASTNLLLLDHLLVTILLGFTILNWWWLLVVWLIQLLVKTGPIFSGQNYHIYDMIRTIK